MSQTPPDPALQTALIHHQAGRTLEAEAHYRQILAASPNHARALNLLGVLQAQTGRHEAAVETLQRSVALEASAAHWCNLGIALKGTGRLEKALEAYRTAIRLQPVFPEAFNNICNLFKDLGRIDEAIDAGREAVRLKRDYAEAFNNLGNVLQLKGDLDAAVQAFRQAISLRPQLAEAHNNYGTALKARGELDEALGAYREALRLRPSHADAHSNLLYAMHFHPGFDAWALKQEHLQWNRQHADTFRRAWPAHGNDRSPGRRLRIGYVSPDFRGHAVGLFMAPLLASHDHTAVEVFCYSDVFSPDALTARLRSHADQWRNILGMTDDQAAGLIMQDKIDILVDLTMHMSRHRLRLFARKPAPVQATYLAYCSTTGLEAMDFRVTDPFLDPPGSDESVYTEKSVRLSETYWCYEPAVDVPDVSALPSINAGGAITFGCLNNFSKVSDLALDTWASIMRGVPASRLVLHAPEGSHRLRVLRRFERAQIAAGRCEFVSFAPTREYLRHYDHIDIALDPFPYGGGTTTCDALFMGIPVITLQGRTAVGRGGVSLLVNLALPEFIAQSPEDYIRIAIELANDVPRLTLLRQTLRQRMQASVLMDAPRFARSMETAYRAMWQVWCAG